MSASSRTPSLPEIFEAYGKVIGQNLRVALPATVTRFDAATQAADVQPLLLLPLTDDDNVRTTERLPVIPNVPVVFPRGSGFHLVFPLAVGDNVLVVFCDQSLDQWKAKGGTDVDPVDNRRHTDSGAVCYPGAYPSTGAVPSFPSNKLVVGKDGVNHAPAARKNDGVGSGTLKLLGIAGAGPLAGALASVSLIYTPGSGGSPQTSVTTAATPAGLPFTISEVITGGSGNVEIAD